MRPAQFLFIDIIGEILYVSIYVSIGYSFGNGWEEILDVIESFSSMIVTGVLL
jgi:membrane protein DedA with SNARE-associated domain